MHLDDVNSLLLIVLTAMQIYQTRLDIRRDKHIAECEKTIKNVKKEIDSQQF